MREQWRLTMQATRLGLARAQPSNMPRDDHPLHLGPVESSGRPALLPRPARTARRARAECGVAETLDAKRQQ